MASKGGKRAGAGNPGYGKMEFIRTNVEKFSPKFWVLMEEWSKSKDFEKQKVFIQEFNKIQTKMIPQEVGGPGGGPIPVQWMSSQSPTPQEVGQIGFTTQPNDG